MVPRRVARRQGRWVRFVVLGVTHRLPARRPLASAMEREADGCAAVDVEAEGGAGRDAAGLASRVAASTICLGHSDGLVARRTLDHATTASPAASTAMAGSQPASSSCGESRTGALHWPPSGRAAPGRVTGRAPTAPRRSRAAPPRPTVRPRSHRAPPTCVSGPPVGPHRARVRARGRVASHHGTPAGRNVVRWRFAVQVRAQRGGMHGVLHAVARTASHLLPPRIARRDRGLRRRGEPFRMKRGGEGANRVAKWEGVG